MIKYRFEVNGKSDRAWLENDEQAIEFAKTMNAEWCRDTVIFKFETYDGFCTFELDYDDIKDFKLNFKNIKIW